MEILECREEVKATHAFLPVKYFRTSVPHSCLLAYAYPGISMTISLPSLTAIAFIVFVLPGLLDA